MVAVNKKTVCLLFSVALVGSLPYLCAAQAINNSEQQESEPVTQSSDSQNLSLFDNDPNFSDGSGFGSDGGELFFRAMIAILFVVVLGFAAFYVSRKLLPKITRLPGKEIHVIETTYLGPHKALHLIEVRNRCLLIGSTNDSITKLIEMTDGFIDTSSQFTDGTGEYK